MNPLISEDEVNALIEQCRSGDTEQKRRAVEALEKAHATQAVPVVLKLLEHEDEFVRLDAVCMVGRLGQEKLDEVGPALIQRLADVDESVRDQAAEALSLLRYQPARAALEKMLLGDAYWVARASAAEALGELGDAQAVPALLQALTDEYYPVRAYAAYAIGQLGDASVLPAVRAHLAREAHPAPRAQLLVVAMRLGDESAFDALLVLCRTVEPENAHDVLVAIDDMLHDGLPAVVERRAGELRFALAELGRRSDKEEYTTLLAARLAETIARTPG